MDYGKIASVVMLLAALVLAWRGYRGAAARDAARKREREKDKG